MINRNRSLPEPTLAEHALIRDSAPTPELSAGFKARVMAECGTSIAAARRAYRLKVAGVTAAVCCLGILVSLSIPDSGDDADAPVVDRASIPVRTISPSNSRGRPTGSSGLSVSSPRPVDGHDPERSHMNEIVDDLNQRQKVFDANMLPRF